MTHTAQNTDATLDVATRLGAVRLTVADLDRATAFYRDAIGLEPLDMADGVQRLGIDGRALVELVADPGASPAPRGTAGLFHLAILVPGRRDLAEAVVRVVDTGARFTGASDHLVSEALYLNDPEGNGIEIYRDRPRDDWPRKGDEIEMATLPLDLDVIMATLGDERPAPRMASGTTLGHVHLKMDDLAAGRRFYAGVLGFDVTTENYPGALFVSAGGYHHHIGMNTWQSNRPAQPGALGLRHFEVVVPDGAELARVVARAEGAGVAAVADGDTAQVDDPAGNRVVLRTP